jgi:hypothetical protein
VVRQVSVTPEIDTLLGRRTARVIDISEHGAILSPFERTDLATDATGAARDASEVIVENVARDSQAVTVANALSDVIDERGIAQDVSQEMNNLGIGRNFSDRFGSTTRLYQRYKKPIGIGLAAITALGIGYYGYRKIKKRQQYDETMEEQPSMPEMAPRQDLMMEESSISPYSRIQDPLSTAGVVGNLDRRKINHTAMGPNKYDYLFS